MSAWDEVQADDFLLLCLSGPPLTFHTSFSDHLGADGEQLTLQPLSPDA